MQFIFPPQRGTIVKKKFCQYCKKETVPLSDSESIYHTLGNLIWQLQSSITEREKKDGYLKLIPLLAQKGPGSTPDNHLYEAVY